MNFVILSGRLTKDPSLSVIATSGMAVSRFSLAVSRGKDKAGKEQTDYPNCIAFGKTAEHIAMYVGKGCAVTLQGKLQTGSYDKDGHKVYTTDVIVDRIEFNTFKEKDEKYEQGKIDIPAPELIPDDDIPF